MAKSNKVKKIVLWIFIALFGIFLLCLGGYYGLQLYVGYELQEMWVQQTKTSKFEDFSSIEDDFKTVADIAFEYKTEILSSELPFLFIDVREGETYVSTYDFDIEIDEKQKKSANTVYYSFRNEGIVTLVSDVNFINGDKDLIFWGDDGWYAIVYCPSDSPNVEDIEGYMGEDAGIVKLSDCWYQVIRHPDH